MADYKELIFSDDFKAYRKKQVEVIGDIVFAFIADSMAGTQRDPIYLLGAMHMAKKLIHLPLELIGDDNLKPVLNKIIQEDLAGITAVLVRKHTNNLG